MEPGPLRIAIFTDSYFPILNGVSVSVNLLVEGLRAEGHQVHIYTAGASHHKDTDPNIFRFRSIETPWSRGYPLAYPPFIRMLYRFRQHTYDIIHSHSPFTLGFVGLRWAESHEIPIVATYHTLYDRYAHYLWGLPKRYVRYRIAKHTNFYYNRVAQAMAPSDLSAKWLQRHSVNTPLHVVPTGIPMGPTFDREQIRHKLGVTPEQKIMLYVGRLAQEKNLDLLLRQRPWFVRPTPMRVCGSWATVPSVAGVSRYAAACRLATGFDSPGSCPAPKFTNITRLPIFSHFHPSARLRAL